MQGGNNIILVKMQPDPDVDPVPVGSNVVVFEDLDWKPYEGNTVTRNRDRPFLGAQEQVKTGAHTAWSLSTEFSQAPVAGTAPAFGPLLRASGMGEVINVGIDVRYSPISNNFEEIAVYQVDDQEQIQKSLNCKGSFGFEFKASELPRLKFSNFKGTYSRPTTLGAAIVIDDSAWEDAVPVSKSATQTATIDSYDMCLESCTYDQNHEVNYNDRPNCKGTSVSGRDGGGTLVIKAPSLTDKDVFAFLESHVNVTKVALQLIHGDGSRPNLTANIPLIQITGLSKETIKGELFYNMPYKAIPGTTGNDEIELIF